MRKVKESAEIMSFYLQPVDGGSVIVHAPGQYIGLHMHINGSEQRRNYSLSAPSDGHELRISVKRESGGIVSSFLHESIHEGDTLKVTPPAGSFTLEPGDKPVILISGGVGITPTLPMLHAALAGQRLVHFIHCARHRGVHAFREHVEALAAKHPHLQRFYCYDEAMETDGAHGVGLLDQERLAMWLPETRDVDVYFLGPKPFMAMVKRALLSLGVPEQQIRYEFFGPAAALN